MKIHVIPIIELPDTYRCRLEACGEVELFSTYIGDPDLPSKVQGAEILVLQPRLHLDIVPYLDMCKFIAIMATGYDALNVKAAQEKGIIVSNISNYCSEAVAEFNFALMFAVCKKLEEGMAILREGKWIKPVEYGFRSFSGRSLGIFGFGSIGQKIAEMSKGFGMKILVCTKNPDKYREHFPGVDFVSFEQMLSVSDFICIAAPAVAETREIFNMAAFRKMKKTAILVNTARGALVNEADLAEACHSGLIGGAGIDVFQKEPPGIDHPLLKAKNVVTSPHVSWATEESWERMWELVVGNVEAFCKGEPINVVN